MDEIPWTKKGSRPLGQVLLSETYIIKAEGWQKKQDRELHLSGLRGGPGEPLLFKAAHRNLEGFVTAFGKYEPIFYLLGEHLFSDPFWGHGGLINLVVHAAGVDIGPGIVFLADHSGMAASRGGKGKNIALI